MRYLTGARAVEDDDIPLIVKECPGEMGDVDNDNDDVIGDGEVKVWDVQLNSRCFSTNYN